MVTGAMNQDLKGIKPFEGIDPLFVAYFLMARERIILHQCCKDGTTVASIEAPGLKAFPIQFPPTPEQHRIVAKIEELFSDLDAGVSALERVKANLKRYRGAVLQAAVTGRLTEAWRDRHPDAEPASELLQRILDERRCKWEEEQLARYAEAGKVPPKEWQARYKEPGPPDITNCQICRSGGAGPPLNSLARFSLGDSVPLRIEVGTTQRSTSVRQTSLRTALTWATYFGENIEFRCRSSRR